MTAENRTLRWSILLAVGAGLFLVGGFVGSMLLQAHARELIDDALLSITLTIEQSTSEIPGVVSAIDSFRLEHGHLGEKVDTLQAILSRHLDRGER